MLWTGGPRASRSTRAGCPRPGSASAAARWATTGRTFRSMAMAPGYGRCNSTSTRAVRRLSRPDWRHRSTASGATWSASARRPVTTYGRSRVTQFTRPPSGACSPVWRPPPPCSGARRLPRAPILSALPLSTRRDGWAALPNQTVTSRSTPPCCGFASPFMWLPRTSPLSPRRSGASWPNWTSTGGYDGTRATPTTGEVPGPFSRPPWAGPRGGRRPCRGAAVPRLGHGPLRRPRPPR